MRVDQPRISAEFEQIRYENEHLQDDLLAVDENHDAFRNWLVEIAGLFPPNSGERSLLAAIIQRFEDIFIGWGSDV